MVGQSTIHAESTMGEVLEAYPGARRALMGRYHIGGCSSCGFAPTDRLAEVLKRHNVLNSGEVIDHIVSSHEQEQRLQITPQDLAAALQRDAVRLLDVRTPEEQDIVMLPGGIRVTQRLVQEMMSSWPKDTAIVTYCHTGLRSLDAASYFIGHGFTNVRSLAGGIDRWAVEIDPALPRY